MGTAQRQVGCEETRLHQRQGNEIARTNCTRTYALGNDQESRTSQQSGQRRETETGSEKTTEIVNNRSTRVKFHGALCFN